MPNVSGLAIKAELNATDGKIPNITGLISNSDYDKDVNKIKTNHVNNSVLTSRLGNHASYTDYNLTILLLENETEKCTPLNCYFVGKDFLWRWW